jgi:cell division septum initiation protein DivIVA
MTQPSGPRPDVPGDSIFETQLRGYNRRQVDEYVARSSRQTRILEEQLTRLAEENEQLHQQLAAAGPSGTTQAPPRHG